MLSCQRISSEVFGVFDPYRLAISAVINNGEKLKRADVAIGEAHGVA